MGALPTRCDQYTGTTNGRTRIAHLAATRPKSNFAATTYTTDTHTPDRIWSLTVQLYPRSQLLKVRCNIVTEN